MSEIDQNGGAIQEVAESSENSKISDHSVDEMHDSDIINDTSLPKEDAERHTTEHENQEGKTSINKLTNESEPSVAKITETEEASNQSRELKQLLASSKEANLETNISTKRKAVNLRKKVRSESRGKGIRIQYPVTAESELELELHSGEVSKMEIQDEESPIVSPGNKSAKRKKSTLSETAGESVADDTPKKTRKSFAHEITLFKPNKDMFCWRCHKDSVNISCETCPRSYHQRCLKQTITDPDHWPCPECVSILKAESTQSRSPALKGMTLENLCSLLKFAVNRMIQCPGSEPFIHAVNDNEFPEYKKYIIQPMDLTLLEKNIKENLYGSTQAFEADAKWILHNSIIFNSYQSKLTSVAKFIIKICKQEMSEIENCPSCYLNANTKKNTWFVEVCPKPHLLVWAKLRGFPFWPGKAMSCKDGTVDVRFFGAHDRAWVPEKECFLYSPKDPNLFRAKRIDIEQCVRELEVHVENLKKIYVEFHYPPFKTPIDPDNEVKQLQMFLPRYTSIQGKHKTSKKHLITEKGGIEVEGMSGTEESKKEKPGASKKEKPSKDVKKRSEKIDAEDESMEGYGTDDETIPEIDTELRKTLLKSSDEAVQNESNEVDYDDTQMPANIEPDTSGSEITLSRESVKRIKGDGKSGSKKSESEPSSKRHSFDDTSPPLKTFRRNSEAKSESSKISDKINKVEIPEEMEISIGNEKTSATFTENISSSNSECSSDFSVEIKKRPVQVDVDNVEFTISPASKLKMADKLMKKLSDVESGEENSINCSSSSKVEKVKRNIDEHAKNNEKQAADAESVSSIDENNVEKESLANTVDKQLEEEKSHNSEPCDSDEDLKNSKPETNTSESDDSSAENLKVKSLEETSSVVAETTYKKSAEVRSEKLNSDTQDEKVREKPDYSPTKSSQIMKWTVSSSPKSTKLKLIIKAGRSDENFDRKRSLEADEMKSTEEDSLTAQSETDCESLPKAFGIMSPQKIRTPEKQTIQLVEDAQRTTAEEEMPERQKEQDNAKGKDDSDEKLGSVPEKEQSVIKEMDSQASESDKSSENGESMDTSVAIDANIDKAKIINIIHSSLGEAMALSKSSNEELRKSSREKLKASANEPVKSATEKRKACRTSSDESKSDSEETTSKNDRAKKKKSKRRRSIEFDDESALETQNKVLKLVSIESIMNKANNNQESGKENDSSPILKSSLHGRKSATPSARTSVDISADEIKSEPESESEAGQDMEAKKKYMHALNILEKGEFDAHKAKPNEIRTRSKTEEKRERFRVSNEPQLVDNMTRIIEDVAVNYRSFREGQPVPKRKSLPATGTKSDSGEIFVKSFAKMAQVTPEINNSSSITPVNKQRARKTFPQPNYNKPFIRPSPAATKAVSTSSVVMSATDNIPKLTPRTPSAVPSSVSVISPTTTTAKATVPPLQQLEAMRPTNGYLILQPPQQDNNFLLLPPNQTISYSSSIANQMMSVTPCLVSAGGTQGVRHLTSPHQHPIIWHPGQNASEKNLLNVSESQNYIPQGESAGASPIANAIGRTAASKSSNKKLVNGLPEPSVTSTPAENTSSVPVTPSTSNIAELAIERLMEKHIDRRTTENAVSTSEPSQPVEPVVIADSVAADEDEFSVLNSIVPENVSRVVSEVIRRPPPRLKARPPGALSQHFNEGNPSSAGPATAKVNSVAHRLGDYFRGMLIETLDDLSRTNNAEATIASLRLEIENLKHRHIVEISEIEKNVCTVLKDIQRSIANDRERIIEETRAACETEAIKRVEEAKSKQWCANCSKEAQFYCCWNTSYCDYPCQQKHWPSHMGKCTQNQPSGVTQVTSSPAVRPGGQQLILRPANPPPKGGLGRVITKPIQKVYMNRSMAAPKTMRVQTSAGNLLTMMETTPGNYQLVTSNAILKTGPSVATLKPSLITVSSPGSASIGASPQQKITPSNRPVRVMGPSLPVTTILEEESD